MTSAKELCHLLGDRVLAAEPMWEPEGQAIHYEGTAGESKG